jgi:hypothetical protein
MTKVIVVAVYVPMIGETCRMTVGVMLGCHYKPVVATEDEAPFVAVEFI